MKIEVWKHFLINNIKENEIPHGDEEIRRLQLQVTQTCTEWAEKMEQGKGDTLCY